MSRKGFLVKVELDVQKVSCPGVCLCSNGKVSLQIHMFGSSVQTRNCRPGFPLSIYEKFVFSKVFDQDRRLNELQRRLNREYMYTELIQWKSCDEGCVLSTFRTTLDDLLYPTSLRGATMGINVDLLMDPTEIFPGSIAPKLEVSTKTSIEETLFDPFCTNSHVTLINPKALSSKHDQDYRPAQRKVCHSLEYSRAQQHDSKSNKKKKKPPFKYQKVPDDLILRTNPNVVMKDCFSQKFSSKPTCYCVDSGATYGPQEFFKSIQECDCKSNMSDHKKNCSTCTFYDRYFSRVQSTDTRHSSSRTFKMPTQTCTRCTKRSTKYHIPSKNGSPCLSDSDSDITDGRSKVCCCVPKEQYNCLAQQLHEKLARTLDTNSKLLQKCIDF